ncbi:MAG: carbohydrate ABC transporter permease, partial [Ruminiclostridium sp.]
LFLAGLQTIPAELIEASVVDGANAFKRFISITIPSIKTVIQIILFLNIRGALQVFDIPFVTTGGGPGYASSTFTVYTLTTAFTFNNFGMASTMGVTLMFLIIILSGIQNKIFNIALEDDKVVRRK